MATAAAGLAGIGILFNVFAPSAMVRFLALGRTAARYGERVLTHEATLRAVSNLRIALLRGLLSRPHRALEHLRAASELNRITADTEVLDGAMLRLVLPSLSAWITVFVASLLLWWLVAPAMALMLGAGYLIMPTAIFLVGQHVAKRPARVAEAAHQVGRSRMVELVSGRDDLTVHGQLPRATRRVLDAFDRAAAARKQLDNIDRMTGLLLDMVRAGVTVGCLLAGIALVQAGKISVAEAAIGVFAALALAEAVAPVRRALAEIGRMTQAARRIAPALHAPYVQTEKAAELSFGEGLELRAVTLEVSGRRLFGPVSLSVRPGETVVLQGASGIGKSTLLLMGGRPAKSFARAGSPVWRRSVAPAGGDSDGTCRSCDAARFTDRGYRGREPEACRARGQRCGALGRVEGHMPCRSPAGARRSGPAPWGAWGRVIGRRSAPAGSGAGDPAGAAIAIAGRTDGGAG